jgi:hypothetical protein
MFLGRLFAILYLIFTYFLLIKIEEIYFKIHMNQIEILVKRNSTLKFIFLIFIYYQLEEKDKIKQENLIFI